MVVPKYVADDYAESDRLYQVLETYLFRGANYTFNAVPGVNESSFISDNRLYQNFEFVNYSAAFGELDKYLVANYFDGDQDATDIYSSSQSSANKIDANHITQPIDDNTLIQVQNYYDSNKN